MAPSALEGPLSPVGQGGRLDVISQSMQVLALPLANPIGRMRWAF